MINQKPAVKNKIEKYIGEFEKKIFSAEQKAILHPNKGTTDCRTLGILTSSKLLSNAFRIGRQLLREREKYELHIIRVGCLYREFRHIHEDGELLPIEIKFHGRSLGTSLFDLTYLHSGYESKKSVEQRKMQKGYEPTAEHYYPRQWAGELMVRHIETFGGITFKQFLAYADTFRQIHWVTKQENKILERSGQNSTEFDSWQECYERAGIELLKVRPGNPITKIEDIAPPTLLEEIFGNKRQSKHK